MERNWSYTIQEGEHKGVTLWSGRYCAVCAMIFCYANGFWHVLANVRNEKCPDYKGYWCMPCGFIEAYETGEQAASRETVEETGMFVFPKDFIFYGVETDPTISNNGNVTLRYYTKIYRGILPETWSVSEEAADIEWIPLNKIEDYDWAFHHKELIYEIINAGILK